MNKLACLLGTVASGATLFAGTIYVTPSGGGDGTGWNSPTTLSAAVGAAGDGDEIWLAAGDYALTETLTTDKAVALIGGFAGEASADERTGTARSVLIGADTAGTSCFEATCAGGLDCTVKCDRIAFRHGNYRGFHKTGFSRTELVDCEFSGNGWGPTGGTGVFITGRGACIDSTDVSAVALVTGCVFSNNLIYTSNTYGGCDGGVGLYVNKHALATVLGCSFVGNGVAKTVSQAPGRDKQTYGGGLMTYDSKIAMTNCTFVGNRMTANGTGDGGSAIGIYDSSRVSNGSSISHCRIIANETMRYSDGSTAMGGAVLYRAGNRSDVLDIDHCTIAYNLAERAKGAGVVSQYGTIHVRNSIVFGNVADSTQVIGSDLVTIDVNQSVINCSYSLLSGKESPYVGKVGSGSSALTLADVVAGDPLFATTAAEMEVIRKVTATDIRYTVDAATLAAMVDVHPKSVKGRYLNGDWTTDDVISPALDIADPADDYTLEPTPNGGRANAGVYGGTIEASKNAIVKPGITKASVAFKADDYTRPYLSLTTGPSEDSYAATVTFCFGLEKPDGEGTEGWQFVQTLSEKIGPEGALADIPALAYLPNGKMYYRVIVTAGTQSDTVDGDCTVDGELPPAWGKGGGEGVIHVWAGGQGTCGGTNWLDAVHDYASAVKLVDANHRTIWIAGTVPCTVKDTTSAFPLVVLGGFTGLECAADERQPGAKSVIDGQTLGAGVMIAQSASYPYDASTISDIVFTNMYVSAASLSSRGMLNLVNCTITRCGWDDSDGARGCGLYVDASSTDTRVLVSNCVFDATYKGIAGGSDGYQFSHQVVYLKTAKEATIADTVFTGCGVARVSEWNSARGREKNEGDVLESAVPVTVERCSFRGNVFTAHNAGHGLIRLTSGSAGTAFRNCEFTGNVGQAYSNGGTCSADGKAGTYADALIVVEGGAAADAYSFDSCTFAYNTTEGGRAPVFSVIKGAVSVNNSIVWANYGLTNTAQTSAYAWKLVQGASAAFLKSADASIAFDYCLVGGPYDLPVTCVEDGVDPSLATATHLLTADPLLVTSTADALSHLRFFFRYGGSSDSFQARYHFANGDAGLAAAGEFAKSFVSHLRGRSGYTDETTGELVTFRRQESPAIDAGDPAADFSREPVQRDGRLNLGCWGNTPWATRRFDAPGALLFIR